LAKRQMLLPELGGKNYTGRDYDPWQKHFLNNRAKFRFLKKSRRVGGTLAAVDDVWVKANERLDQGYRCQGISIRLKDAELLIESFRDLHDDMPPRFKRPIRGSDSMTEIALEHPNGKRSVFTAYPNRAPRSRGGDIILDEFAHGREDRKVFTGALPCVSLDEIDQLTALSTPFVKTGMFYDLDRRADGRYKNWFHYNIPWWLCPRLCTDVKTTEVEAPILSTRERVERFATETLQEIFDSFPDLETFQVEYELAFLEAVAALFSPELLDELCEVEWGDCKGSGFPCKVIEGIPTELDWMWLLANTRGVLHGGFDVGRERHESAYLIWDIAGKVKELRMIIRMFKTPYKEQKEVLEACVKKTNILRTCIDSTGIGAELAENLAREYPARFEGIVFTPQSKDQLATRMYIACIAAEREVWMPRYRPLILHFISIRKEAGSGSQVRYSVDLNEQLEGVRHHADLFWAGCLGLEAEVRSGLRWKVGDLIVRAPETPADNLDRIYG